MNPLICHAEGNLRRPELVDGLTAPPFNATAPSYDAVFTNTRLGRWLREAVWERLAATFRPGDHVLELGCGTGEDAVWLAQRGVHVVATDASPAMLEVAQRKAEVTGVVKRVSCVRLDLAELRDWSLEIGDSDRSISNLQSSTSNLQSLSSKLQSPLPKYDGAFSNFGALNCLPDRRPIAKALAQWVRPGGQVVLVVMGPLCPWEVVWHLAHGEVRATFRRLRSGIAAQVGDGAIVRVWYPSPCRLRSEFAPYFRHLNTVGIGVLLPPSYLNHLVERWPHLFKTLATLDRWLGRAFPWTWLNDHYLMVFERN